VAVHNKDDAAAVLQELRVAVRSGTFDDRGLDVPREAAPLTFRECTERYTERHVIAKDLALAKTIHYRLKPLLERFGDRPLSEIRTADIEDFITDLKKPRAGGPAHGRPLSPASINRNLQLLRHIFNWAVGREYIDRTPFRRGNVTLIAIQREDNMRRRRIDEEEEAKLLETASPMLRGMMMAALDTGMRRGEMFALRVADVDLNRQLITLRGHTTKSGKTRFVPIATARLTAVFEWLRVDAAGHQKPDDALIFSNEVGEPVGSIRTAWTIAVLKAHRVNVEWMKGKQWRHLAPACLEHFRKIDLHWHDLRHEYASRLVERGVPLAQVRDLLGHASITTTERYDNQKLENLQAAAARLEVGKVFAPSIQAKRSVSAHGKRRRTKRVKPTLTAPPVTTKQPEENAVEAAVARSSEQMKEVPIADGRTFYQVSIKNPSRKPRQSDSNRGAETELNPLQGNSLGTWLGGRDSNPDNVVQSHVSYR
jgi:site-specific recombinase XerD